jgi:hypothetical protein
VCIYSDRLLSPIHPLARAFHITDTSSESSLTPGVTGEGRVQGSSSGEGVGDTLVSKTVRQSLKGDGVIRNKKLTGRSKNLAHISVVLLNIKGDDHSLWEEGKRQ